MNKTLGIALLVVAIAALVVGIFFVGYVFASSNAWGGTSFAGTGGNYVYGPGMMNRWGGYGMMQGAGGYGPGMMGGWRGYGPGGMMGGYGYRQSGVAPLSVDQAKVAAEQYLSNINNPDLKISEIMVFDNNAYVAVKEASTGIGAFELLVDPVTQRAFPEYGPNMMWNLKYSALNHQYMMGGRGGMMGGYGWSAVPPQANAQMTVTAEQAVQYAQTCLDSNIPGSTAASDPMQFYGYYTLDFTKDGKVSGMLSINGYSGQVFLHTWHGTFIAESEIQ